MILKNIVKKYDEKVVFDHLDFELFDGEITAILGASGCGKTTLLNIISGLTDYEGEFLPPEKVSYIFQQQRLVPNLSVRGNLEYVLSDKKGNEDSIKKIIEKIELSEYIDKYPAELSGGMAQRVSLARAFLYDASVMLMDEPFKGLDVSLKKRMIELLKKLLRGENRTVIFVTHDIDEALLLADRIVVMGEGGKILFDDRIDAGREERSIGDGIELKNKLFDIL